MRFAPKPARIRSCRTQYLQMRQWERIIQPARCRECIIGPIETQACKDIMLRNRPYFERRLRDDPQRAERTAHYLHQVVASDVLHHTAATVDELPAMTDIAD